MNPQLTIPLDDGLRRADVKRHFNRQHFNIVASRYDTDTRLLSFGRDWHWKRKLIQMLPALRSPVCLDLACGTGDLAELLTDRFPNSLIIAVDLSDQMLPVARSRLSGRPVHLVQGDLCSLPIADQSIHIVTAGYALRNAPDLDAALNEISRVLAPGGWLALLDFSKPETRPLQAVQYFLLRFWGGVWGQLLYRDHRVHGYIAASLRTFPTRSQFHRKLTRFGLQPQHVIRGFAGMVELLLARKVQPIRSQMQTHDCSFRYAIS